MLVSILVLGALLRLAYLVEVREAPAFAAPGVDAGFHDYWARGIATGRWVEPPGAGDPGISTSPYFRPPGYPYFLAAVYRVFGDGPLAPRVVQMALGLVNAVLAWFLARRWLGRIAGLAAAALASGSWVLIYFEAELHDPVLFNGLVLAFLLLLGAWHERRRWFWAAAAGFACGLAALVRPNALAVLAAGVVWMVALAWRERPLRRLAVSTLALAAGASVAVAPATIRNAVVSGDPVPISSNTGINFFIGNNASANGLVAVEIDGLGAFRTCFDWPGIVRGLEQRLGRGLRDSEVSSYFLREGLRFVREHPAAFARLTWRKALLFWGPDEVGHNTEVHYERRFSRVLDAIPGSFALLLALAATGAGAIALDRAAGARDRRRFAALLVLVIGAYFLSVLPFFAAARYRVPVVPLLALFAAYAIERGWGAVRERDVRAGAAIVVATLGLWALTSRSFAGYEPSLARWHFDRGTDYERAGRPEAAAEPYRRALEADPGFFEAHYNLAHRLRDEGRLDEAIAHWEAAGRAQPRFAAVHANLAAAYREAGDLERALVHAERAAELRPDSANDRMQLADLLIAAGRAADALVHYRRTIELRPGDVAALRNAAWILAVHPDPAVRDPALAVELGERAVAAGGGESPSVLDALAAAYAAAGRFVEAAATASDAVERARTSGAEGLARRIESRLERYRAASSAPG